MAKSADDVPIDLHLCKVLIKVPDKRQCVQALRSEKERPTSDILAQPL